MWAEYVAQLDATHDTVNTEREFCTTSGRTVQVYSSVYGWKIDQEKRNRNHYAGNDCRSTDKPGTGIRYAGQMHGE